MTTFLQNTLVLSPLLFVLACGGSQPTGGTHYNRTDPSELKQPEPTTVTDSEVEEYMEESKVGIEKEMAELILDRGARKVRECSKSADAPAGEGDVSVTFDGESGRVTKVDVGVMWSDAPKRAQACIQNAFLGEMFPPFEGTETMSKTVTIPNPGAEEGE